VVQFSTKHLTPMNTLNSALAEVKGSLLETVSDAQIFDDAFSKGYLKGREHGHLDGVERGKNNAINSMTPYHHPKNDCWVIPNQNGGYGSEAQAIIAQALMKISKLSYQEVYLLSRMISAGLVKES
jgi:hypothetical protein